MSPHPEQLVESARRGLLHHSMILHGPSPEARRALADQLAMAANCPRGSAGDDCSSCDRIRRGVHPDVHIVDVGDDRKLIAIEQVRATIGEAMFRPYEGRTKVFIIDPAEAMSPGAANALLKTLEEPARDTLFLLLTRSPDLLLQTIRSRSQAVPVEPEQGPRKAGEIQLEPKTVTALARGIVERLRRYVSQDDTGALLSIAQLVAGAEPVKEAIALYAMVLRDLAARGDSDLVDAESLAAIRKRIAPGHLLAAATSALEAIDRMIVNADPRLLVEQSLIRLKKT